ncbi:MAG TPA: GAF domain-containing protein [Reyranella sp.]|nr:GAF domain-containing protein [Reyranella sp.]
MKRGLFLKYVILFIALVTGVLVLNAALDLWFVYQDNRRAAIDVQREKAESAAQKIESFVREIERQIGWVAYPQFDTLPAEQRRFDYVRLLRQVPAITELSQLDREGREQLKVSRLSMDVVGSNLDRSAEAAFKEAKANKVYFGPVYFRKESEPYLTMAVAHGGRGGVTVAEVNLKLAWDVVSQIKVGKDGYAYVVDQLGRLVAHPDISLVLRGTDMSKLAQVAAALQPQGGDEAPVDAMNRLGVKVLSAHAFIPALNWLVFVELPIAEAQQPVIDSALRDLALLVVGLLIAAIIAALLARRLVVPIRALQEGAQRIGGGELSHRIAIKTGDELEALADQFNRSTEALQESYATLEQRVEDRTAELRETLEQQTATAEVLQVISESPTDVQPVLKAVVAAARRLCGAEDAAIILQQGDHVAFAAHDGPLGGEIGQLVERDRTSVMGRSITDGKTVHLPDVAAADPVEFARARQLAEQMGFNASVAAPMLREGVAIGCVLLRKRAMGPYTSRQIELLETFAAQAVIAIENVRLFTELRETLEQQTATADILQVISSSPTDVQPVLDAVVKAAVRFCGAIDAVIVMRQGEQWSGVAHEGPLHAPIGGAFPLNRETAPGRAMIDCQTVHYPDISALDPVEHASEHRNAKLMDFNAVLCAPLLRDDTAIGAIALRRRDTGAFMPRQIGLLESFAAQAVIAIQNVRLFTELSESLEQQTATADILQVISESPTDVAPVLNAVVSAALRFSGAEDAVIVLREGDETVVAAHEGTLSTPMGLRRPVEGGNITGRVIFSGETLHIPDIDQVDRAEFAGSIALSREHGWNAAFAVPMLREGVAVGAIMLRKIARGPFSPRHIEMAETFAAQAVIAIENVRLFTEIQEKSRQLEVASQHKSQFLANMSHELRTPLNAIIGYTEMMSDGLYGDVPDKAQGVLERVQSNGRHLLGLINDVLDLSKIEAGQLVLAIEDYSVGDMVNTVMAATESLARTKKLALTANIASGLPTGHGDARRLSQVLLNLVGNAIKFTDQGGVEIKAVTAGERFEVSVIDSGPGIAPADQAKIFEEFQQVDNTSTRKKGGTGLGLSISRKIVELHGGAITVQSEVGKGSTFTVSIPVSAVPIKEAAQ